MLRSSFWRHLAFAVSCVLLLTISLSLTMAPRMALAQGTSISVVPSSGPPNTQVTATGDGFPSNDATIQIWFDQTNIKSTSADANGHFSVGFNIPSNATPGLHPVYATDGREQASTSFNVTQQTTPTVIVQKVFTADGNNNAKTVFAPGDVIHYIAQVTNSGSSTVTATFTFLATGPQQIFSWSGPGPVAAGTVGFYSPSTIPANAPAGTYTLTVTVTYNGQSSTNAGQFTVIGNPTPSPTQPPTPNPTTVPTTIPTQPPTPSLTQPPTPNPTASENIRLSESSGTAGLAPGVFGAGFPPNTQITIQWFPPGSSNGKILTTAPSPVIADEHGNFNTLIQIPQNSPLGQGMVCALDAQITACTNFMVVPVPTPQPPEINSGDVACEGLLIGGALLGLLELAVGVGEVGCARIGSLLEFWQ